MMTPKPNKRIPDLPLLPEELVDEPVIEAVYHYGTDTTYQRPATSGSSSATATVANVTETQYGFPGGGPQTFSFNEFANKLLSRYQAPGFADFSIDDQRSRTLEVGSAVPAGFKSIKWAISNGQNVTASSVSLRDITGNTTLLNNEANDGVASASTAAFTVINGESRRYRLTAKNSQNQDFAADLTISGAYASYFGYSALPSLNAAQILSLGNAQLQNGRARTIGGVTASGYTYYGYEVSGGDLTSIILDGAAPVLGAFQKLGDFPITNAQGAAVSIRLYRSNAVDAFSNNTLAFS